MDLQHARYSAIAFVCLVLANATVAAAANPPSTQPLPTDVTEVSGQSFAGSSGLIKVNLTAGSGNQQTNVAAIIAGPDPLHLHVTQSTGLSGEENGAAAFADSAFANTVGIIQVNQSAGIGTAQANAVVVRLGADASEMTDSALGAIAPQNTTSAIAPPSNGGNVVGASSDAFRNADGIVQINQSSGTANSTANTFLLQIEQHGAGH